MTMTWEQKFDRRYQRELLMAMLDAHPDWIEVVPLTYEERERAAVNLRYLEGHGLCESGVTIGNDGHISFGKSRITTKAIDFLADAGIFSASMPLHRRGFGVRGGLDE
jgi:hypothetical protein